jgi:hypothetical protein
MMDVKLFDRDHLPGRRLYSKTVHATRRSTELGREMSIARDEMSRRIAELIVKEPDLFKVQGDGLTITQVADVVVLTQDELADFAREKFKQGLDHAMHFTSSHAER